MSILVQSKVSVLSGSGATSLTYDADPTAGHLLIAVLTERGGAGPHGTPSGWTKVDETYAVFNDRASIYYRLAPGGAVTVSIVGPTNGRRFLIAEFAVDAIAVSHLVRSAQSPSSSHPTGPVSTSALALLVGLVTAYDTGGGRHTTFTEAPSFATIDTGLVDSLYAPTHIVGYREIVVAGSYTYTPTDDQGAYGGTGWGGILVSFELRPPFTADFSAEPLTGLPPLSVEFTDLSAGGTGTPDTWLWDFGDGLTSTSQDPVHVYDESGSYTVTLTVETDDAETDSETRISYVNVGIVYVPPPPAQALVEIYAAVPGSARWGLAHWAEDVWSSAAWQDVTPESVTARILWGSNRPELGILSQPDAGSWAITTYDPGRLLDPSNMSSPYAADLIPGLPVRITHRGLVIRQGTVESIGYAFRYREHTGYLRVTDNIARLANADVPDDSTLPDTMWARARAAISAAGVAVEVLPDPPSGDPALVPWVTGTQQSAWEWIADAARQCLSIPYIDNIGRLGFRPWAVPLNRARNLTSPELVELLAISSYDGLYSRVQAREDPDGPVTERGLTPTPRYGKRTYSRTEPVLDAGAWAQAVLEDRALPRIRWAPSDLYPSTAEAVERLATIAAVELVGIRVDEADPPILTDAIIVGGEINLTGKRGSSALWRFAFEATAVALQPLGVDGADPPEFLYLSDGSDYLYPD